MSTQHIVVQWEPREEGASAIAKQLAAVMEWLRTVDGLDGTWSAAPPGALTLDPCDSAEALERAVIAGAQPFPTAREPAPEVRFHKQDFYLGRLRSFRAHLQIVAGADRPVAGLGLVNRLDLELRAPLPPVACRQVLVGLVGVLRPVAGFVGDGAVLARALRPGAPPPVGPFTFLSAWFGGPPPLPETVRVSSIKSFGTLLQSFDGSGPSARMTSSGDARALAALEATLRKSGWLRPYPSEP